MEFLKEVVKEIKNEYASLVSEGIAAGDCDQFIDSGSYIVNALLSGSIYGGFPANKITAIAGDPGTGKTFFCLGVVRQFLASNPKAGVVYFESESAISKQMIESRGIDSNRMLIVPVATVQEFKNQAIKIVEKYNEQKEKGGLLFILDSLGNLSTSKEMEDSIAGSETKDMTRAAIVKAAFRVLTLKLGQSNIPMIVTNHTYDVVGSRYPQKEMSGGSGLKYTASSILYLAKRKEKDGEEQVGNIIRVKAQKSRFTIENSEVETRLYFDARGLERHYGLLELASEFDIIPKIGTRYEIGDKKVYGKNILEDPDKYFTPELLELINAAAQKKFLYGNED